jgi:RNA polymerase-binding transcription factor DksA
MPETTANDANNKMIEAIERDLNDVDVAMDRLEKGTYFSDEVTGASLRPEFLATNPLARRNPN